MANFARCENGDYGLQHQFCFGYVDGVVQAEFDIPVLGVILPGAEAAVQQGKRIGVIATPATAASNAYRNAILEMNDACRGVAG